MIGRACLLAFMLAAACASGKAATLLDGFAETLVASGLSEPTAMAFAPDGRLFVCQQGGQLRVIKNGALLPAPFLTVTTDATGERGLLGVTFDPNFAANQFVYVYYTVTSSPRHNRVSRFTANGDTVAPNSEVVVIELSDLSATIHNGGAIHFGPDGKLYIATGENGVPSNAQTFSNLLGKILRLNSDGAIPADNPFINQVAGQSRAIWALGLRNPYTFAFQPGAQRMFINDVGQNTWEEINLGGAGLNYGWPDIEGPGNSGIFTGPIFAYGHGFGDTLGCAITGGAFYNPPVNQFPSEYVGHYFFADFCGGWIRQLNPADNSVTGFANDIESPVDLQVGPDGQLYYLSRGGGAVFKIRFIDDLPPAINTHPASQTINAGQPVTFTVTASGTPPLAYQWQRNGVNIDGATSSSYTIPVVTNADNGAQFRVEVSNVVGSVISHSATLTVPSNRPPVATIVTPVSGTLYSAGETILYSGVATDPEDGQLPARAFTWQIDFHHDAHVHPFITATSGADRSGFTIPATGETSPNVWYRIILTVTDSGGATHTVFRDVFPRTSNIMLATSPAGLKLTLDGQTVTTPFSFVSVVGMQRTLGVVSSQAGCELFYEFNSWADGGAATRTIATPASDTVYVAQFVPRDGQSANTLSFSATQYAAPESAGHIPVTVTRLGNVNAAATIFYSSSNETATDVGDYTTATGRLNFAPGESSKTFDVLIADDVFVEGEESLTLTLSQATGGFFIGSPCVARLKITDNDSAPSSANPIDDARFFVRQHYHDFLNREPDAGGLDYWSEQIAACGDNAACLDERRVAVSAAFFIEQEFQQTGFFLHRFAKAALGLNPTYLQLTTDRNTLQGAADLEAGKQAYAETYVQRADFKNKYGATSTCPAFTDALLQNVRQNSGVEMAARRSELINECNTYANETTIQRARVIRKLIEYQEFVQAEYNPAFVLAQYFEYLRRDPDTGGYQFWLDVVRNRDPNNYLGMVQAFVNSPEYRARFGP
jgi:glucose/arabinose dehydrogenase